MKRSPLTVIAALLAAMLVASGCGQDDNGDNGAPPATNGETAPTSQISTPAPLEEGGTFTFCTDVPYPPAEYIDEQGNFVGYEIDIAEEVAERLGTDAEFQRTGFDGIIAALQAGRCDAIISSMNVTPEREEQVSFVEYMEIGQSLLVQPDDADEITTLDDLSGRRVGVQVGTTLLQELRERSQQFQEEDREPIDIVTFPDAGAAASALRADNVDAFFGDSPVVAEYVNRQPEQFAFGGAPIDPLPVGIAIRQDDTELRDAVQEAIDGMYEDGAMERILEEWNIADFRLVGGDETRVPPPTNGEVGNAAGNA